MDRDAHARAALRREAEDALTFERDREAMLTAELQDLLAGATRQDIEQVVFAAMSEEEVALVRAALGGGPGPPAWNDEDGEAEPEEPDEPERLDEEELQRLQGEIEASRRSQAALARYLELLDVRTELTET